jgi:hypothetical protein
MLPPAYKLKFGIHPEQKKEPIDDPMESVKSRTFTKSSYLKYKPIQVAVLFQLFYSQLDLGG